MGPTPTDRRFPVQRTSASDGVRSRLPLRGSPRFALGSLLSPTKVGRQHGDHYVAGSVWCQPAGRIAPSGRPLRAGTIQRLFRDMHAGTQHVVASPPPYRATDRGGGSGSRGGPQEEAEGRQQKRQLRGFSLPLRSSKRSCGPNCWKHRASRRASRCHCATSRGTTTVLFHLEVHARSRCLACGEIAKGIDNDAQSTRVRSIGRGDGGLAGVGRLGSSVNHRLA
jgi:hypothetical protein